MRCFLIIVAALLSACGGPDFSTTYQKTDLGRGYTFVASNDIKILPEMTIPGDGGPMWRPGYATLYDPRGESLGSMRVPYRGMLETPDLRGNRVCVSFLGEWDVAKRTCYFFGEDQNVKLPCP